MELRARGARVGIGRYQVYDATARLTVPKDQLAFFASIASVHYRADYLQSWACIGKSAS
jgi:hypothetical protein